ncbi:MAG: nitrilase-related carbon-nitrogen hydrolase, partial [bacterium]|nr:nitrilase-related carbon-nitrogen hydrolase [bacterium]
MKIAGIQITSSDTCEENLRKAQRYVAHGAESGARILCFSQLFLNGWFLIHEEDEHFALACRRDGAIMSRLADTARQHDVVLVCPFFEKREDKHFSSAAVFDRDGTLAGVYQKLHIPQIPGWKEKYYFAPGEEGLPVFETAYGRIGVQLCWDNFFPEPTRVLALKGADIIFAPTAAAYASQERWYHV